MGNSRRFGDVGYESAFTPTSRHRSARLTTWEKCHEETLTGHTSVGLYKLKFNDTFCTSHRHNDTG